MTKPDIIFSHFLHYQHSDLAKGEPISLPIVNASTFAYPGDPDNRPYYGRPSNPTIEKVEESLGFLEGAPVVLFPSGMAAITALCHAALRKGDQVLVPDDCYYNTRAMLTALFEPQGISLRFCPTIELADTDLNGISLILFETPSNPGLDICDISKLVSRAKSSGARVAVDNTLATPLVQNPINLGADYVVMSDTKAMGGHSDLLAGHVASRDAEFIERVRDYRKMSGALLGPMEAFLLHRGLETLEIRLARMQTNAEAIARFLNTHSKIDNVKYPGLPHHRGHTIATAQMKGFGSIVSFNMPNKTLAESFINNCRCLVSSTSFGSVHSSAERRERWGDNVDEGFVRLSCGIEPTHELLDTIQDALGNTFV